MVSLRYVLGAQKLSSSRFCDQLGDAGATILCDALRESKLTNEQRAGTGPERLNFISLVALPCGYGTAAVVRRVWGRVVVLPKFTFKFQFCVFTHYRLLWTTTPAPDLPRLHFTSADARAEAMAEAVE